MTEDATPAGWHPDPENPSALRWWDGSVWAARTPESIASTPTTSEGKIAQYLQFAESELARANKMGRLDAQTVHAARATAAATIALTYILNGEKRQ